MNKLISFLTITWLTCGVYAQLTTFSKDYSFGFGINLTGNATEALTPQNYIFTGVNATSLPIRSSITEVNSTGNVVWSRTYNLSLAYQLTDIKRDDALGQYYVCGGNETGGGVFMIVDAGGAPLTTKNITLAQASGVYFNSVKKTTDGGYILAGYVSGYDPDGAGPEIPFNPITYIDNDGNSQTDRIYSPIIMKLNSSGDHLWHQVTRYYTAATRNPGERIYNSASFSDVQEVSDGFIAVGGYKVNEHRSRQNSDGDDATPRDAIILKVNSSGAIVYHRQIDNPDTDPNQTTKYYNSINPTTSGEPVLAGYHGSGVRIIGQRLPASGGWTGTTWSRRLGATTTFCITPSLPFTCTTSNDEIEARIFELSDGNYGILGQRIVPLSFDFAQALMKFNPSSNNFIFAKRFQASFFASFFPVGGQVSDNGYLSLSMGGSMTSGWGFTLTKFDDNGNLNSDCPTQDIETTRENYSPTFAEPHYRAWGANTVSTPSLTPIVLTPTPSETEICLSIVCTPPAAPTTVTANPATICPGESSIITASGPSDPNVNYNVYDAATGGTNLGATPLTVSPTSTTSYWVEAVDNTDPNCVSTTRTEVVVTVNDGPTVSNAGEDQTVCGNSTTLAGNTATSGTGTWTVISGSGTFANANNPTTTVSGLGNGTNVFRWTISNPPCPDSFDEVTITSVTAPTVANAGNDQTLCATSTTLEGNTPTVGSGTWTVVSGSGTFADANNPTTTVSGLGNGANVFQWTITNAPCPASSDQVTITNTGGPTTANAGNDQTICGTSATLEGNTAAVGTGTWTVISGSGTFTDASNPTTTVSGLSAGANVFQWTISNDPCVPSTDQVTITAVETPTTASAGSNQTLCATSTTLEGNTPTVGTGTWSVVSGTGTFADASNPTTAVTGLGLGDNIFEWTITNDPCPASSDQVTITNTGGPTVSIVSTSDVSCNGGNNGEATVSASGGVAPYNYSWSPSGGSNATATGLSPGDYTATVTDNLGCSDNILVTIGEPSAITLDLSSTASSCATPDGTATVIASGGNGSYTYSWSPSGGNADVANGLAPGEYTVTVQDATLCEVSESVTVGVSDGPVITIESTTLPLCNGGSDGSAEISVTGGTGNYTYSWDPSVGSGPIVTGLSYGIYTVTVEDEAGCQAVENITIGEFDALSVSENIVNATCTGDDGSISLTVSGGVSGYSYAWQPNNETTSSITGNAGNYTVTITDANNCEITADYTIGLTNNLVATVDPSITTIEGGESVDLLVTIDPELDNVTYTWTPTEGLSCSDCPNPTASPSETTTYEVAVLSDNGCYDTAQAIIIVTTPCGDIFMPTIFSPNGDGLNDELCLLGNCIVELDLKIYDRWGELVFETTDQNNCWDGTFRGRIMNSAVFVYKLFVRTTDGQEVEESGNVNLVR